MLYLKYYNNYSNLDLGIIEISPYVCRWFEQNFKATNQASASNVPKLSINIIILCDLWNKGVLYEIA